MAENNSEKIEIITIYSGIDALKEEKITEKKAKERVLKRRKKAKAQRKKLRIHEEEGFLDFIFHFFHFMRKEEKLKKKKTPKYHKIPSKEAYAEFKKKIDKHRKKQRIKKFEESLKERVEKVTKKVEKPKAQPETKIQVPEKVEVEIKNLKELKEFANLFKEAKKEVGIKTVYQQLKQEETIEDKISRLKQMIKDLDYEYLKRHITEKEYLKRKFEYQSTLRFLLAQKKQLEKEGVKEKKPKAVSSSISMPPTSDKEFVAPEKELPSPLPGIRSSESVPKPAEKEVGKQVEPAKAVTSRVSEEAKPKKISPLEEIETEKPIVKKEEELARPEPVLEIIPEFRKKAVLKERIIKEWLPLNTSIEKMFEKIKSKKEILFEELQKELGWTQHSVEKVGKIFEKHGLVDVVYPATMIQKPKIKFLKELPEEKPKEWKAKVIDSYEFEVDFVPAKVTIIESIDERRPYFVVSLPKIGPYTQLFVNELKEEIAEKIPVEVSEVTDAKKSKELKKRFFNTSKNELKKYFLDEDYQKVDTLAGLLLHMMYGLGKIEILMGDNFLEEIAVNSSKTPVTVYHKKYGWMKSNIFVDTEEETSNYASQIGRKVGRDINVLNPILDAHLVSGDRVNATLAPISSFGNTLTIRRFARRPWTIIDFIGPSHSMNIEMASLLWMAMHYEMNIIVAGGTASGKTSTLNALSAFIPSYHRIISIEDVREIMLPEYMHWNWVPLSTRNPNPEGLGEVSMLELMQSSLRMRPDRIILGEIRRKREAEVLFEAMHTGHSVYSTLHANSSRQVLRRLIEPPIEIPPLEIEAVDLILVQYRDRRTNLRRTFEMSEIESGVSGEQLTLNTVFKWSPREDEWDAINPASRFIRQINLHTGMTEKEITDELMDRARILNWMLENNLSDINQVGKVMKLFYAEPETVKEAARKNSSPNKVLEE